MTFLPHKGYNCVVLSFIMVVGGIVIDRDDRIIGGRYAEHGEWPSSVAVSFSPGRSSCSANILTPLTLLTACHCTLQHVPGDGEESNETICMWDVAYSGWDLVAGSISREPYQFQGFQVRFVYYVERHPQCARSDETEEWVYDVAIIHLTEELIFNELVQPIAILSRDRKVFKNIVDTWQDQRKECQVAGWGFTAARLLKKRGGHLGTVEEALNASEILKVLDMRLMTTDECCDFICQWERHIERHDCKQRLRNAGLDRVCAVPRFQANGTICGGDSGGPLRCDEFVIGVVSYGTRCTQLDFPIVFARVDAVLPFLLPHLGPASETSGRSSALSILTVNTFSLAFPMFVGRIFRLMTLFYFLRV